MEKRTDFRFDWLSLLLLLLTVVGFMGEKSMFTTSTSISSSI